MNAAEINFITSARSAGNLNFTNRFYWCSLSVSQFISANLFFFFYCRRLNCECLSDFWLSRDLFSWLFSDVGGDAAIFGFQIGIHKHLWRWLKYVSKCEAAIKNFIKLLTYFTSKFRGFLAKPHRWLEKAAAEHNAVYCDVIKCEER